MRSAYRLALSSVLLLSESTLHAGCSTEADNCDSALSCPSYLGAAAPPDPLCGEPISKDAGPASDCGVFASASAPAGGDGTKATPFNSLQGALDQAATTSQVVFACAETFAENVHVPPGVALYGALDCENGWAWTAQRRTTVQPSASASTPVGGSEVALRIDPGSGAVIEDVDVVAPDGEALGVSSIAVLANGATAHLTRCTFTAGKGADGAAAMDDSGTGLSGAQGDDGGDVCTAGLTNPGADGPVTTCPIGGSSAGGNGGDGGLLNGSTLLPGSPGTAGMPSNPQAGQGGAGQTDPTMWCAAGSHGRDGAAGMPGPGAELASLGSLSAAGFTGSPGGNGSDGAPGQGGGGGGGAMGTTSHTCSGGPPAAHVGASGGSGGAGGCGGQHGTGGGSGGSSIGLLSLKASLTLDSIEIVAAASGSGGQGGKGQLGGNGAPGGRNGGNSGSSASPACNGGDGGNGGNGGPGGGGRGGHSLGIAYTGTMPSGGTVMSMGAAGASGPGGPANGGSGASGGAGAPGIAAATQAFP